MTCAAHAHEIEMREQRIAALEAECQRLGNIITALADELAGTRMGHFADRGRSSLMYARGL